jgi:hypothetical protein
VEGLVTFLTAHFRLAPDLPAHRREFAS